MTNNPDKGKGVAGEESKDLPPAQTSVTEANGENNDQEGRDQQLPAQEASTSTVEPTVQEASNSTKEATGAEKTPETAKGARRPPRPRWMISDIRRVIALTRGGMSYADIQDENEVEVDDEDEADDEVEADEDSEDDDEDENDDEDEDDDEDDDADEGAALV
ncbi:hypothetical protein CCMA1212_005354 [Trichoderma ghanense]|uniref:Histone chaperone domain-containing protein n=1 Tax=Trichoderma ghanense TaxID=65468 RepID=A0ABY2H4Q2_9HYPO